MARVFGRIHEEVIQRLELGLRWIMINGLPPLATVGVAVAGNSNAAERAAPVMSVEAIVRYDIKRGFQKSRNHGRVTVSWLWGSILCG